MLKWILLTTLLVSGSAATQNRPIKDATPAQLAAIKKSLERNLKDAESVRFDSVKFKGEFFCGLINAKNSFGAYAGYRSMFGAVMPVEKKLVGIVMSMDDEDVTRSMCDKEGIPLPPL